MKLKTTAYLAAAFSTLAFAAAAPAAATDYPTKPVTLIVPLAPGGSADGTARLLAKHLGEVWKQPVIVENRPGAAAGVGIGAVARAQPDGYTLLLTPVSISTGKVYVKNPGYDAEKDFTHITQLITTNYVISVNEKFPAKNLTELIAYAKDKPEGLFHGAGAGGMLLASEFFAQKVGIKLTQVNYRGEAPAMSALASGDTQIVFSSALAARPFFESGKVRPLAVASKSRVPFAADLPSAAESGLPDFEIDFWFGLSAPANTPLDIVKKIGDEVARFLKTPEAAEKLKKLGFAPKSSTPEEFTKHVAAETARWTEVARRAGIKPQ